MTRLLFTLLVATFALTAVTVVAENGASESRAHGAVDRDHTQPGGSVATSSPREADPDFGRAPRPPKREPAARSHDAVLIAS